MDLAHNYSPLATIKCYDTTIRISQALLVYVGILYFCGANEEVAAIPK